MLFSEGFVVGPSVEDELHSVTALANRSQLAVYCIESQGLETRELRGDLVPRDDLTTTLQNPQDNKIPRGGETGFDRARQAVVICVKARCGIFQCNWRIPYSQY